MKKRVILGVLMGGLALVGCESKEMKAYKEAVEDRESKGRIVKLFEDKLPEYIARCDNGREKLKQYWQQGRPAGNYFDEVMENCEAINGYREVIELAKTQHQEALKKETELKAKLPKAP